MLLLLLLQLLMAARTLACRRTVSDTLGFGCILAHRSAMNCDASSVIACAKEATFYPAIIRNCLDGRGVCLARTD